MRTWTFAEVRPPAGGPWDTEPDKAQWVDEATGLDCLIVRAEPGSLCGYVGLPPGHPLHGESAHAAAKVWVHGGVNFASSCQEGAEDGYGVCHVPEPGRPHDVWWLGFDCAHIPGDKCPTYAVTVAEVLGEDNTFAKGTYRTFEYVKGEVESLARQLAAK